MKSAEYQRRLNRLEAQRPRQHGKIITINPDSWPADVQDAYRAARLDGDQDRQDDLIEQMTGERPFHVPDEINLIIVGRDSTFHGPLVTIEDREPGIVA
jgi:hypothetical protein